MKKLLGILLICCFSLATYTAKSQASFVGTTTNPTRAILDATADTAKYTLSAPSYTVSIETKVTKTSGTMAGKVYLWSSVGGVSYNLIDSASLSNTTTQYSTFNITGKAHRYWMIIQSGGTTVAGILNAKVSTAR